MLIAVSVKFNRTETITIARPIVDVTRPKNAKVKLIAFIYVFFGYN